MVLGAKRLGYMGKTTRVENRGEMAREETSWGGNVLLPGMKAPDMPDQPNPGHFCCSGVYLI